MERNNKRDGYKRIWIKVRLLLLISASLVVLVLAMWGPEYLTDYRDKMRLNQVTVEAVEGENEGYRYLLGANDKLYILSKCLNSQSQPGSEISMLTKTDSSEVNYEELTGAYAFVVNRQGPSGKEITEAEIYEICNREISQLREKGILPDTVKEVTATAYSAVLYSAIDVLEPRNNMSVWKVSLSTDKQNADKSGRLLDAYIDGETGKIYEFYVRIKTDWEQMKPDEVMTAWADYMGLLGMEEYESDNPLLENTPYYKKYRFEGPDGRGTVVTLGFYEGIKEFFLKVAR
ncbi:MAG: hypothetical protein NC081_07400 [Roseburia sp.]|nr:hypothetical protein [Roseburia sp.]